MKSHKYFCLLFTLVLACLKMNLVGAACGAGTYARHYRYWRCYNCPTGQYQSSNSHYNYNCIHCPTVSTKCTYIYFFIFD